MLSLHHLLSFLLGSSSTENWWKICCRDQTRKITQACFNQLANFADILSIAAIFILRQGRGEQVIHKGCFLYIYTSFAKDWSSCAKYAALYICLAFVYVFILVLELCSWFQGLEMPFLSILFVCICLLFYCLFVCIFVC